MSVYKQLTKFGIVVFAMTSAIAGYALSFESYEAFNFVEPMLLLIGLYFLCSGSFAINQAQEWKIDLRMERTKSRPIPAGKVSPLQAWLFGLVFVTFGAVTLLILNPFTAYLGLATVIMYNLLYTLFFKRQLAFGAVPGAVPGAMPVVIGYSVNSPEIFRAECVYVFLVMFLWQMPHFWTLAIRYREDYKKGGFPVLPVNIGVHRTLFHIGLYTFVYVGLALASPWFLKTHILYLMFVLPLAIKIVFEFLKYYQSDSEKSWLPFFLWTNLSMLIFLGAPVFDKWIYISLS